MRLICLFLCFSLPLAGENLALSVAAEEAILINADTGAILFEKEAHKQAFPASITKIATALYTLKNKRDELSSVVTAPREALCSISPAAKKQSNYRGPPHWLESDSTHVGIKNGEELTLNDLMHAMLLSSANDASNVIANYVGGSIPVFMERLNLYLKEIGCRGTCFLNPHGLHHPGHFTTAYDMALIARVAMRDPLFREIVSKVTYLAPRTNLEEERTFKQTNLLLRGGAYKYSYATGIKTGTTQVAGKTLVASADNGERRLIAVVLGNRGGERYSDVIKMFEAAFNEPKMRRRLLPQGIQEMTTAVPGASGVLKTYLPEALSYEYYPSEEEEVKVRVQWELPPLPIAKGSPVGVLRLITASQRVLAQTPLYAYDNLEPSLWHRCKAGIKEKRGLIFGTIGVLSALSLLLLRRRRRFAR